MVLSGISSVNASNHDIAFDSPKHHQKSGGHGKNIMKGMIKALSLSEQQQVQIKTIKIQAKAQHIALRDGMKKFKEEERSLVQAQTFDEQAYSILHVAYQPIFAQKALMQAKTKHAVFNVLTIPQQEKWLKIMDERKEKRQQKRG